MANINNAFDLFGSAFLDYINGDLSAIIKIHSDIEEVQEVPVSLFFRGIDQMNVLERKALAAARGKILDVGAGAGCHSLILQKSGFDVTAMEVSQLACEALKLQGLRKVINLDFFQLKHDSFDTILFLMNGIGISGDLKNLPEFFETAKSLLKKGGQIIVESGDIEHTYYEEDGSYKIDLQKDYSGEVKYQLEYKDQIGPTFSWLFVDFETLKQTVQDQEFDCELIHTDPQTNGFLARLSARG